MNQNSLSLALLIPEISLVLVVILLMVTEFLFKRQRARLLMLAAVGVLFAYMFSTSPMDDQGKSIFSGALKIDAWTTVFRNIAFASAGAALLLGLSPNTFTWARGKDTIDALAEEDSNLGEFSILILLSTVGVCLMASSTDMLVTMISLEIMSLPVYSMITLARTKGSFESSIKYFLMGAAASAVMLFGMSIIVGSTGSTRYAFIRPTVDQHLFGITLFVAGLFFKIAAVPFHAWMPDVYQKTPAAIGAFMSAAVKAAGFAALGRLLVMVLPMPAGFPEGFVTILLVTAALTMFVGNGAAMFQKDFARLLGYSSIAHTGFMLVALAASMKVQKTYGVQAMVFYLMSYVPAAIGAFAIVGVIERKKWDPDPFAAGDRNISSIDGLYYRQPVLALALVVILASLAGLPPTIGFWAKLRVFMAAYHAGILGLVIVALANSLLAAYYYVRVIKAAFTDVGETAESSERGWVYTIVAVIASLFLIGSGIIPETMMKIADISTQVLR